MTGGEALLQKISMYRAVYDRPVVDARGLGSTINTGAMCESVSGKLGVVAAKLWREDLGCTYR